MQLSHELARAHIEDLHRDARRARSAKATTRRLKGVRRFRGGR